MCFTKPFSLARSNEKVPMIQENIHFDQHTIMFSHMSKEEGRGNRSGENYLLRSLLVCITSQIFSVITWKRITYAVHVELIRRGEAYWGFRRLKLIRIYK